MGRYRDLNWEISPESKIDRRRRIPPPLSAALLRRPPPAPRRPPHSTAVRRQLPASRRTSTAPRPATHVARPIKKAPPPSVPGRGATTTADYCLGTTTTLIFPVTLFPNLISTL